MMDYMTSDLIQNVSKTNILHKIETRLKSEPSFLLTPIKWIVEAKKYPNESNETTKDER